MKIVNAKIYTCDKQFTVIDNGFVEVRNAKIVNVGKCAPNSSGDIDAKGKKLFPGFIDCSLYIRRSHSYSRKVSDLATNTSRRGSTVIKYE